MTRYVVNNEPFETLQVFSEEPDFNQVGFKNLEYRHITVNPFCRRIIDTMMSYITEFKKYQYVFVRICDTQLPWGFWHLDSSLNPVAEYENFLFVTGAHCTEFVMNHMVIEHVETVSQFHQQIESHAPVIQSLPAYTVCRYTGSHTHRRPLITTPEQRLLIRLSNTDVRLTRYA